MPLRSESNHRWCAISSGVGISVSVVFFMPSFLPQAIETIQTKNTSGISLSMYALFTFGTFLWLCYGLFSHNLPISIANGTTLLFALVILFYKIKYK